MDDRERPVCAACGYVHYVGPALAAGVILRDGGKFCLLRRALRPGRGKWTFPGGFVDLDEEPAAAALREAVEETGYPAEIGELVGVYASWGPRKKRVIIVVYTGRVTGPRGEPSDHGVEEVQEVGWFTSEEIPWEDLAFESTRLALREHLDRERGPTG
jgi:ADP-ribose pyrophosphatase YjhB (NUDIX family)